MFKKTTKKVKFFCRDQCTFLLSNVNLITTRLNTRIWIINCYRTLNYAKIICCIDWNEPRAVINWASPCAVYNWELSTMRTMHYIPTMLEKHITCSLCSSCLSSNFSGWITKHAQCCLRIKMCLVRFNN